MTRAMKERNMSRAGSHLSANGYIVLLMFFLEATVLAEGMAIDTTGVCPRIVSREEWKARKPKDWDPMVVSPVAYVVVHHGGLARYCDDESSCSAIARSYQDLHLDVRGWNDIGYSFLVGEDGNAYLGRGWDRLGAHAPGYNSQSVGICIMGDFSDRLPNEAALKALNSLIACGVANGKISKDYKVIGHRQVRNTVCPGETFYNYVMKLPNWTNDPVPLFFNDVSSTEANVVSEKYFVQVADKAKEDTK